MLFPLFKLSESRSSFYQSFRRLSFSPKKNYDVASFLAKRFAQATSFLLGSSMKMARVSPFFFTKTDDEVVEGGVVVVD